MLLLPRLPILSRCYLARRGTPLVLLFPPLSAPDTFSPGQKERPASRERDPSERPYLHIDCLPFLIPEILPIITDARESEIAFAYGTNCPVPPCKGPRSSLTVSHSTVSKGPRKAVRYHARSRSEKFSIASHHIG